jgi:hypothetical protein
MKNFETVSDLGSLRIGNDDFTLLLPNGYGDCENDVTITDTDNIDETELKGFNFMGSLKVENGKDMFIYHSDIDDEYYDKEKLESGEYNIYRYTNDSFDAITNCEFIFVRKNRVINN